MTLTLINARPSPFGRKVAIAMEEKGLDYKVRYDVPWSEESCTPQFSPLEQLPIVIDEGGERVYDSSYILTWLETRYPDPALLPAEPTLRLNAQLRQMLGERLMEVAQSLILETQRTSPSQAWIDRQTRKIIGVLNELECQCSGRQVNLDEVVDFGDIAVATTLLLFEFAVTAGLSPQIAALEWRGKYAGMTAYIEQLENRPSFKVTTPDSMNVDLRATVS